MVLDLPAAYVGYKAGAARAARRDMTSMAGVLSALVECRAKVALEREQRLTVALALKQLPAGSCLAIRDMNGRKLYLGPVEAPIAIKMREAA